MTTRPKSGEAAADYGLLPRDRTFSGSLPAFLFPYLAYVALADLPHRFLPPAWAETVRFATVGLLLFRYRRRYRLGPPLTWGGAGAACAAAAAGLIAWILLYRASLALPIAAFRETAALAAAADPGPGYVLMRTLDSALLVPFFEELFCRAYIGELLAGLPSRGSFSSRLGRRMEDRPGPLAEPPARGRAAWGAALVFTAGHAAAAWPAALAYFALTTVYYRRTRSFRGCILIHGLVNLAIAGLAQTGPGMRFLWY